MDVDVSDNDDATSVPEVAKIELLLNSESEAKVEAILLYLSWLVMDVDVYDNDNAM